MHTYQNLTDHELVILNVGVVPPQGTIETDLELSSTPIAAVSSQ